MIVIGLMSGTSADGIDAAVVDIRGRGSKTRLKLLDFISLPYSPPMRGAILAECDPKAARIPEVCALNTALGELFGQAAVAAAEAAGVALVDVAAVASHGQTIWHQPVSRVIGGLAVRGTLQIGDPAVIAARTGCRVISGFRSADMAAGGQGAPLIPFADWALLTSDSESRAVLNIGGIANITYLPRGATLDEVRAFDTGPGNMVIDRLAWRLSDGKVNIDADGEWAARGKVDRRLLSRLLNNPYFFVEPPKSTGREMFGAEFADRLWKTQTKNGVKPEDLLATATALTADSIDMAFDRYIAAWGGAYKIIVGGGGAKNKTLVKMMLCSERMVSHEEFGIPSDAKEAIAFALLGYETLHGRPSNVPSATGAARSVVLGTVTPLPTPMPGEV